MVVEENWARLEIEMTSYLVDRSFRWRTWRDGETRSYLSELSPPPACGEIGGEDILGRGLGVSAKPEAGRLGAAAAARLRLG